MISKNIIQTAFVLLLLVAASCQQVPTYSGTETGTYDERKFEPSIRIETSTFDSADDYLNFAKKNQEGSGSYYGIGRGMALDMVMEDAAVAPQAAPSAGKMSGEGSAGVDYSGTNVQVEGIDEADILKTDGEYIYTITRNTLFIIRAYPGEDAEIISSVDLYSNPRGMFLYDDKLAVIGNLNDLTEVREEGISPRNGITYLNIYDISSKENPELVKDYKFEGNYFQARMKGNHMYLVLNSGIIYRPGPMPLPIIMEGDDVASVQPRDISYFNIPYSNPGMVHVHSVDLESLEKENSKSMVIERGENLYMSDDNIYVTYTERINEYEIRQEILMRLLDDYLTEEDRILIQKIKDTDNDVLSQPEKESKIWQIYSNYLYTMGSEEQKDLEDEAEDLLKKELEKFEYMEYTLIHRVAIDDGIIEVESNGKVPGHVLNQFSMDENNDVFRIATSVSPTWSMLEKERTLSTNNVYTLDEDMEILGELEGLAEDESIFSTRFIDDRLYMVTFRQIDPFFVIDLSDPKNPKTLGELKIPGFSRYLHPYDENTIIGLGRDATETGRQEGIKISLFDVSDVSNPEEIVNYIGDEDYAQSEALFEHKAFLFSKDKELLVIPVYNHDYRDSTGYAGALAFKINEDNIELRGLIDHSQGSGYYGNQVERSLYIQDLLYTKSPGLLRINDLDDLSSIKNIELKTSPSGIKVY